MSGSGFSSRACSATSLTSPPPLHPLRFTVSPPQYGQFQSKEEAEAFLRKYKKIVKMDPKYAQYCSLSKDPYLYQSIDEHMDGIKDKEHVPVLYSLYHCVYDHYPYDKDVLEVTDKTLNTMKEAYRQIRIAEIYANRIDWMMSGDDSEDTMQDRLKQELEAFEEEFKNKDWTLLNQDSDD